MTGRSLAALALVLAIAAGCEQVAGLGSPPPLATAACGIEAGSSTCAQCASTHCCVAASACAGTPECSMYEDCLVPCAGDYACRARCFVEHTPATYLAADLDQCIASSCSSECGATCGMTASYTEPDAGDACYQCLQANACTEAQACFDDVACSEISQCSATEPSLDGVFGCFQRDPAGAKLYAAYLARSEQHCLGICTGHYWECVGDVSPGLRGTTSAATFHLNDFYATNQPIAGATVNACSASSFTCDQFASQTTDAAGDATVTVTDGPGGFSGYFEFLAKGYVPTLQFVEFGLQAPAFTVAEGLFAPGDLQAIYQQATSGEDAGAAPDSSLGTVIAFASDCHWTPAPGATVEAAGGGHRIRRYYAGGGDVTGSLGATFFFDVEPGWLSLDMTVPGPGRVAKAVPVFARAGAVSLVTLHPN